MLPLTALMGFLLLSGGAQVAAPVPARPEAVAAPLYTVTLTAYNAVPEQTDNSPLETASGAFSNPEIIAARSQDLAGELPFGTVIEISGPVGSQNSCGFGVVRNIVGYRVIADTMNARYTKRIDILFSTEANYAQRDGSTKNAGMILGICKGAAVRVVGRVDMTRLPKTQKELARLIEGSGALAVK